MVPALPSRFLIGDSTEPWNGLAAAYLAEKYGRSGSERTTTEYGRLLRRFFEQTGRPPDAVRPMDVHAFAYGPGPTGRMPSPSTISVRLAAIAGFFDLAVRMECLDHNPAASVRRPHPARRVPRTVSPETVRRLLAAIPGDGYGARDRAVILTAVMTGLRRAEIANLRTDDFADLDPPLLFVRTKGGHHRRIQVPPPAAAAIAGWIASRPPALQADPRLFGLSSAGLYAAIRRRARRADLDEAISPHCLRHAAARLWRADGAPIEEIAALLGHSSLATTARYLSRSGVPTGNHWQAVATAIGLPSPTGPADRTVGPPAMKGDSR